MKTISKTYNGSVKTTANQGFSIKRAVKTIKRELLKKGYTIDKESIAKTGTTYLNIGKTNDRFYDVNIRISNHTKRGCDLEFTETLEFYNGTLFDVNVLNTEMLHAFLNYINK